MLASTRTHQRAPTYRFAACARLSQSFKPQPAYRGITMARNKQGATVFLVPAPYEASLAPASTLPAPVKGPTAVPTAAASPDALGAPEWLVEDYDTGSQDEGDAGSPTRPPPAR